MDRFAFIVETEQLDLDERAEAASQVMKPPPPPPRSSCYSGAESGNIHLIAAAYSKPLLSSPILSSGDRVPRQPGAALGRSGAGGAGNNASGSHSSDDDAYSRCSQIHTSTPSRPFTTIIADTSCIISEGRMLLLLLQLGAMHLLE